MSTARSVSSISLALVLACGASPSGCTRPNPAFDDGEASTDTAAGEATGGESPGELQDESGTAAGTGAGTGGELEVSCGNGILDPGEGCDDANDDDADGCLFDCIIPQTCAQILEHAPQSESGPYRVDPGSSGEPWLVICDMDLDGGGWTGFEVQDTCNGHLTSEVVALTEAPTQGRDELCRPFMEYPEGGGEGGYFMDIGFPPGFSAFFLRDYSVKAIGTPELKHPQLLWEMPFDFPNGSLSLGDANEEGPIANWVTDGGTPDPFAEDEIKPYPVLESPFELAQSTTTLRIGWGETGVYHEGLYPWWSGRIFVR